MKWLPKHPALEGIRQNSEKLIDDLGTAKRVHNTATGKLMEHVLKAQAELLRGQMAVVEHMIGRVQKISKEPADEGDEKETTPRARRAPAAKN